METRDRLQSCDDISATTDETSTEITSNDVVPSQKKSFKEHREKENKYELTEGFREILQDFPDILEFIQMLQKCIEKQKKKLKKNKNKKSKMKPASTQTELETKPTNQIIEAKPNLIKSVTEEITEAAQQALQTNGFVYEETSGLYYDYNSGYYYNAEYGLYYDGNTGTYLKFNQDTKEYEFHSQIDVQVANEVPPSQPSDKLSKRMRNKSQKNKRDESHDGDLDDASARDGKRHKRDAPLDALEDGECSELSESTSSCCSDEIESDIDVSKQHPPCMRIIVAETSISCLKQGSLHVITFEGGSIGREGAHALLLPELNTSKHHARITFDADRNAYYLVDVGSRNGTLLNGKRLASAKRESEPHEIPHGSRVQIGSTTLLCHIHSGSQTCGHCEPGLLQSRDDGVAREHDAKTTKSTEHKHQLKQLRKKFGLAASDQGKTAPGAGYTDRASRRRATVGSQNPHEKTHAASLSESIASHNKGFKLLAKMGWKEGQALGKDNQGRLEPIELSSNPGTSGLGATGDAQAAQPTAQFQPSLECNAKQAAWAKAQERYKQARVHTTEDIFDLNEI